MFSTRENVLNSFKSGLFPIKNLHKIPTREPAPEPAAEPNKPNKSKLKLQQEFMNELIANEKDINDEI